MNEQAALAELKGNQAETETQVQSQSIPQTPKMEYVELPYNGQNLKLPHDIPFPINHNGAIQNVPLSKMMNTWRQFSHIEDKQKKFKEEQQTWQQKMQQFQQWEELYPKYSQFDEWAQKNPEQWEKLYNLYQNKDVYLNQGEKQDFSPDHPIMKQFSNFSKTIEELQGKLSKYEKFEQEQEIVKAQEAVKGEIEGFKKEFPQIDLDEKDLDGISLRGQILKFAEEGGYPTFRAAALEFKSSDGTPLISKLLDTAQREGRNAAVKSVKQETKNGVIERSSIPFGQGNNVDIRRLKSSDRESMALEELKPFFQG